MIRNAHAVGMESLRELFRIGNGPSSSHTMGPERAARIFKEKTPAATCYKVTLYGSLAMTGKGHHTDEIIRRSFEPAECEIDFDTKKDSLPHPNTMKLQAYRGENLLLEETYLSVGGGAIRLYGSEEEPARPYRHRFFSEISEYCRKKKMTLWQYVEEVEGSEIWDYLNDVWQTMQGAVNEGLDATGELEGGLHVQKKARTLYRMRHMDESAEVRENRLVCAYAYAVSEQNASGGRIVTAPTCGSCGVIPAVLYYTQERRRFTDEEILHSLAAAGVVGNIIKTNASISGAECGCQAEIGSACAMAAAALASLYDMDLDQIEYAAEISLEHHLGLTCDPIAGLVQIPCIERNAVAAMRAINAATLANFLTDSRKISFDLVVETMYETGQDLSKDYRETSRGGLAKLYL